MGIIYQIRPMSQALLAFPDETGGKGLTYWAEVQFIAAIRPYEGDSDALLMLGLQG